MKKLLASIKGSKSSKKKVEKAPSLTQRTGPAQPVIPDPELQYSFEAIKLLGHGSTGETWLCKELKTQDLVAVKLIPRPFPKALLPEHVEREIKIQTELGDSHINIINALELIVTTTNLALVLEYAQGGSLTNYVSARWQHAQHLGSFLSEDEARYLFRQFISAVEYCHQHNVAHRDLKLDNTLLDGARPPCIKICDFGFAKGWTADSNMYTHIGTPVYMSPELIDSRYGLHGYDAKAVDVWASGVMLLAMLLGTFPFDSTDSDPDNKDVQVEVWMQQMGQNWSSIPHIKDAVARLSPDCRDLMDRIFTVNEQQRINVAGIKAHAWYNKPLLPKFQTAQDALDAQQAELSARMRSRKLDEAKKAQMWTDLHNMVEAAYRRASREQNDPRRGPLKRLDLREDAVLERLQPSDGEPTVTQAESAAETLRDAGGL